MNPKATAIAGYARSHSPSDTVVIIERLLSKDSWIESKHPRDNDGRFASAPDTGGGTGGTTSTEANKGNQKIGKSVRVGPPTDVTEEYKKNAKPGAGKITEAPGYKEEDSPKGRRERENAEWLVATFGGDLTMNKQSSRKGESGIKNPEYTWRGKFWEYKEPERPTKTSAKNNTHKGLHQISKNPGGVLLDITKSGMDFETAESGVVERARQSAHFPVDVIIVRHGDKYKVLRFKPE